MERQKLMLVIQNYVGMTPKDLGCQNWNEMQQKMSDEILGVDVIKEPIFKEPEIGNVFRKKGERSFVVKGYNIEEIKANLTDYEFVCEQAHNDGDFSYLCGSDWCRCCQ